MAFENKIFDTPDYMNDVGYVRNTLNKALDLLSHYDNDDSMMSLDDDEIKDLLSDMEKACVSCRSTMEDLNWNSVERNLNDENEAYDNMPVDVVFQNNILRISAPLTFDRSYQDAHYLGNCVRVGLNQYKAEHGDDSLWHKIHAPFYMLMVRYTPASKRTRFRDNDHTEDANIINTVVSQFGISDKPTDMSYMAVALPVKSNDDARVEFYFFNAEELPKAVSWLLLKQKV